MDTQQILAILIVGAAALLLVWRGIAKRKISRLKSCSDCACSSADKTPVAEPKIDTQRRL